MSYNWMYFSFTGRWALARGGEGGGGGGLQAVVYGLYASCRITVIH